MLTGLQEASDNLLHLLLKTCPDITVTEMRFLHRVTHATLGGRVRSQSQIKRSQSRWFGRIRMFTCPRADTKPAGQIVLQIRPEDIRRAGMCAVHLHWPSQFLITMSLGLTSIPDVTECKLEYNTIKQRLYYIDGNLLAAKWAGRTPTFTLNSFTGKYCNIFMWLAVMLARDRNSELHTGDLIRLCSTWTSLD